MLSLILTVSLTRNAITICFLVPCPNAKASLNTKCDPNLIPNDFPKPRPGGAWFFRPFAVLPLAFSPPGFLLPGFFLIWLGRIRQGAVSLFCDILDGCVNNTVIVTVQKLGEKQSFACV